MNQRLQEAYAIYLETEELRHQLMSWLTDADLGFALPSNPALGVLCRQIGETQQSYIDSFKTFKQDFGYRAPHAADLECSVAKLVAWYADLNAQMKTALEGIDDATFETQMIDRGFPMSIGAQLHTLREALLIFYGKTTVYLLAMGKPLSPKWRAWVG